MYKYTNLLSPMPESMENVYYMEIKSCSMDWYVAFLIRFLTPFGIIAVWSLVHWSRQ